ncbi:MAG: thiamine pyrophosphate-binding protein, partial [Patescibacteria group bacterium]
LTTDGRTIRQLGVQHINIIEGAKPYSKYAVMVTDQRDIRYHLEKAVFLAKTGRKGPVWLDLPTNLQHAQIEPQKLTGYQEADRALSDGLPSSETIKQVLMMLKKSQRPIIIAGHGVRLSDPRRGPAKLLALLNKLRFPFILTWNGLDLISHDHPFFIGSAGVMGQRGSNYAIANADLIIAIGSRLDTRQVGNKPDLYARLAKKVVIDIDEHELGKNLLKIDLPIVAPADKFIEALTKQIKINNIPDVSDWLKKCREWKAKYPVVLPAYYKTKKRINSYIFIQELCRNLKDDDIVVTDMGTSLTSTMQTFKVKGRQRIFTNTGFAPMGYGLPGAIGAWFGGGGRRIIGIFGDGGFQMNIQELQTVVHYKIPLKIFILNNESYLTIKHTQEMFFDRYYSGSEPKSGYSAPNFTKIAKAYGVVAYRLGDLRKLQTMIKLMLSAKHSSSPVLCEVMMPVDQPLIPLSVLDKSRGYLGSPIERMYPFLPEEEHQSNMLIEPV